MERDRSMVSRGILISKETWTTTSTRGCFHGSSTVNRGDVDCFHGACSRVQIKWNRAPRGEGKTYLFILMIQLRKTPFNLLRDEIVYFAQFPVNLARGGKNEEFLFISQFFLLPFSYHEIRLSFFKLFNVPITLRYIFHKYIYFLLQNQTSNRNEEFLFISDFFLLSFSHEIKIIFNYIIFLKLLNKLIFI